MFFRTPAILPLLYQGLTWRKESSEKIIYLTFDDGPVPGPTEFVLEQLNRFNAKATFFCIGDNVSKHPAIFTRVLEQNHSIGNHTYNHLKGWNFNVEEYVQNVEKCARVLPADPVETRRKLFRPPYGRIRRSQIRALHEYEIVMWDVLTYDYSQTLEPQKCLEGSIRAVRPGSIVVFHDSLKAQKNMMYALPALLEHFTKMNYSFKAL